MTAAHARAALIVVAIAAGIAVGSGAAVDAPAAQAAAGWTRVSIAGLLVSVDAGRHTLTLETARGRLRVRTTAFTSLAVAPSRDAPVRLPVRSVVEGVQLSDGSVIAGVVILGGAGSPHESGRLSATPIGTWLGQLDPPVGAHQTVASLSQGEDGVPAGVHSGVDPAVRAAQAAAGIRSPGSATAVAAATEGTVATRSGSSTGATAARAAPGARAETTTAATAAGAATAAWAPPAEPTVAAEPAATAAMAVDASATDARPATAATAGSAVAPECRRGAAAGRMVRMARTAKTDGRGRAATVGTAATGETVGAPRGAAAPAVRRARTAWAAGAAAARATGVLRAATATDERRCGAIAGRAPWWGSGPPSAPDRAHEPVA